MSLVRDPRWRVGSATAEQLSRLKVLARVLSEPRYRLRDADGSFVHACDFGARTKERAYAWIGFKKNLDAVRSRHPHLARLEVVAVPPERFAIDPVDARHLS
jgi:hypothetical protein